jgi:glycerate-2-kinase
MRGLEGLQRDARSLLDVARSAADPGPAVSRAFPADLGGACCLFAAGKAAAPMLGAAVRRARELGVSVSGVFAACAEEASAQVRAMVDGLGVPCEVRGCDHPLPTRRSVSAAQGVLAWLDGLPAGVTLVVLLSGGASAYLAMPGVGIDRYAQLTAALQGAGATIREINAVRRHLEPGVKGGGLLRACKGRGVVQLVLSDVVGDRPEDIGSGPFVADPSTVVDAANVLEKYGLADAELLEALSETVKADDAITGNVATRIVANNASVVEAVASAAALMGYAVKARTCVEGEAREAGRLLLGEHRGVGCCTVFGGEWTVDTRGGESPTGVGGPSQELALSVVAARSCGERGDAWALLVYSTDGRDGPTEASGAIVDTFTAERARAIGLDCASALRRHDSFGACERLGVLLPRGQGTNLNHIAVLLS